MLQQLIYGWPMATKFSRKLFPWVEQRTHPGNSGSTKGEESGECASGSNVFGGPLLQEKRAGSALCRRPRTPARVSLSSGLFSPKHFQYPHQFSAKVSETPLPAATSTGHDNDKNLMAADVATEHVGTVWRQQQSRRMGTEMLCYFWHVWRDTRLRNQHFLENKHRHTGNGK